MEARAGRNASKAGTSEYAGGSVTGSRSTTGFGAIKTAALGTYALAYSTRAYATFATGTVSATGGSGSRSHYGKEALLRNSLNNLLGTSTFAWSIKIYRIYF